MALTANRQWQLAAAATFVLVLGGVIASCLSGGAEFNSSPMDDGAPAAIVGPEY